MRTRNALCALTCLVCASSPASGQLIRGRVLDAATREPVSNVTLQLLGERRTIATATSDSAGRFVLQPRAAGSFRITAARLGYTASESPVLELAATDTAMIELQLGADPVALAPVVVDPRQRYLTSVGFYERMKSGTGDFATADEIARRNTYSIIDILRGMRGVKIQRVGSRNELYLASPQCLPQIVVDGVTIRWGGRMPGIPQPLDEVVDGAHVDAIEVYRGGSGAPTAFVGPNAACGVILIWTRHR